MYLVNEIHEAFEDPKCLEVRAVFLDISKAFDKVWHEGLLFKLKQNGVSGKLLKLFGNYLHGRKQRVVLNGSYSGFLPIESGVPQGSVLGPLLFLVYINDLEMNVKSKIKFFADDTMLFSIVENPLISAQELNHDLKLIHQWAHQWKLEFNPDPSKQATEMLFSCKKRSPAHPPLLFNGSVVANVKEQKHLGLILEPNLSFDKHLHQKMSKAKKNIGILRHMSNFLPLSTLDKMYKAFVRCHLDYCDMIYHAPVVVKPPPFGISLSSLMEKVERIQYQAALAITGTWQGSSRSKLYDELGWESLSDRRNNRRIQQIHKIIDNKTPLYLKDKLPPRRRLFLPNVFREKPCRTNRYLGSFFPDSIRCWNIIISDFQNFLAFTKFKNYITTLVRPVRKSVFGLHDPAGLHRLFQLSLGLSPLRSHKKRHNFLDTPSDKCLCREGVENTSHFFLSCPFYTIHREILLKTVSDILTNNNIESENLLSIFLYGNNSLGLQDNTSILSATLTFIKNSNRFSK